MYTKVLIGKSLQLEKTDTAKSKNDIGKGFCSQARPVSFAAIPYICPIKLSAGLTSLMRLSL
jgi:hypothetical protein